MTKRKLFPVVIATTVVASLLFAGALPAAHPAAVAAGPQQGGVFRIAFPTDVPTGDPAHAGYDLESWSVAVAVYNGLMNYGHGPDLHPELASSYAISNGGKR
jgi:ABC-type transport system substrate-binding protein